MTANIQTDFGEEKTHLITLFWVIRNQKSMFSRCITLFFVERNSLWFSVSFVERKFGPQNSSMTHTISLGHPQIAISQHGEFYRLEFEKNRPLFQNDRRTDSGMTKTVENPSRDPVQVLHERMSFSLSFDIIVSRFKYTGSNKTSHGQTKREIPTGFLYGFRHLRRYIVQR